MNFLDFVLDFVLDSVLDFAVLLSCPGPGPGLGPGLVLDLLSGFLGFAVWFSWICCLAFLDLLFCIFALALALALALGSPDWPRLAPGGPD